MAIGILYREKLREYDFGPGHSFRGDRYAAFIQFLKQHLPEDDNYNIIEAECASDDDLLVICDPDYIDFTRKFYRAAHLGVDIAGPFARYHSLDNRPMGKPGRLEEAARLVVGQAKLACDQVQSGQLTRAVSIGGGLHHAHRDYGEGFCIYNDVAFCAMHLMRNWGLERILVLDTDAHAGNGTSAYFYDSSRVLLIDIHQDPTTLYPGTGFPHQIGQGEGTGYTINVPLPLYAGNASYQLVFDEVVQPVAEEYRPQIVIRNGGSDPHFGDGLTNLGLTIQGFRMIGETVARLSDQLCQGKLIDLLASGYNNRILPYAWLSLICGLAGIDLPVADPDPVPERFKTDRALDDTRASVEQVKRRLRDYWRNLR